MAGILISRPPSYKTTQVVIGNTDPKYSPEVALSDIRKEYEEKMKEQYEAAAERLRSERDEALRENWILQQKQSAALPEQLAASGLNGGAAESTAARLNAEYQEGRNDIREGYISDLGELSEKQAEQQTEVEKGYNEKWLEYLMSLAEMEKKYQYEMYL